MSKIWAGLIVEGKQSVAESFSPERGFGETRGDYFHDAILI
jgi:hypothetical protein